MDIATIKGKTRSLGAPPDWDESKGTCETLPVRDVQTDIGHCMISAWKPSAEELAALNAGQAVHLWVYGIAHPVVSVTVGDTE